MLKKSSNTRYQVKILTTKNVKLLNMIRLLKRLKAKMVYSKAVRTAESASAKDNGNRYYVMPSTVRGKVIIFDRSQFRQLKRKHYVKESMKIQDCVKNCFYHTRDKAGNEMHPLLVEKGRKRFMQWSLYRRKEEK